MVQCPICGAEITEDFGIVECHSCQAQLVIHIDGRVEHAGAVDSTTDEKVMVEDEDSSSPEEAPAFFDAPQEFDPEPDAEVSKVMTAPVAAPPPLPEPTQYTPSPSAPPDLATKGRDPLAILEDYEEEEEEESEEYVSSAPPIHPIDSADLADLARFANSAESGGRDGSLRYTLYIEGIDTADVREAFKEAITDKKLLWDTEGILRSIRRGEVKIENVSSAKAHIVVTRLKLLPLTVSWEQHAIHEG